jgi:hypothetical protein
VKRACVIGWPVEHSRSPAIHRYWLELYGIDGAYEKEAVRPEEFASFLGSLSDRGYAGANVTLPHKTGGAAARDQSRRICAGDRRSQYALARRRGTAERQQYRRLRLHD